MDASRSFGGPCAGGIFQSVKHPADEQGSTLGAAGRCFFAFMRTYTMACLTSRGDVRARAWNRSSQTRPVRLSMRLTARATRIERPMSPRERELLSAASTSKCKWSVCTEKCTRRNQDRAVRPSARRISRNTTWRRKLGKRRDARSVTWTDVDGVSFLVLRASRVGNRPSKARALSSRPASLSASRSKRELLLTPPFHVTWLLIYNHTTSCSQSRKANLRTHSLVSTGPIDREQLLPEPRMLAHLAHS